MRTLSLFTTPYCKQPAHHTQSSVHKAETQLADPPPRDPALLLRLRALSKFPRIPNRTKKYQSFVTHALSKYQTS